MTTQAADLKAQFAEQDAAAEAARRQAEKTYWQLVRRSDKAKPGDAAALAELLVTLGRSREELDRNLAAMAAVRELQARAVDLSGVDEEYAAAHAAFAAADEAWKKAEKARNAAYGETHNVQQRVQQARDVEHRLVDARKNRPGLFGDPFDAELDPAPVEDAGPSMACKICGAPAHVIGRQPVRSKHHGVVGEDVGWKCSGPRSHRYVTRENAPTSDTESS